MSFNFGSTGSGSGGGFTFGGGDANKPAFGAPASNDKKAFNFGGLAGSGAPAFGGFTSPTSAASSPGTLASPPNTASPGLFGGAGMKSPSFGGFGTAANQNQNAVSPFGQTSQAQAPQTGGMNLSYGANTTPAQPAPGFGQPAPTSATSSTGLTFGSPAGSGGFAGFKTPASGFSAAPQPAASTAAPSFNFGGGAAGLSFGGANTSAGLNLGATTTTPAATGLSFGNPSATAATGLSFGNPGVAATSTGSSFGSPASTASTGLSFGAPTSTGLSFGNPGAAATPTGLSFGNPTAATSAGLSFASPAATTAAPAFNPPSTGASFNFAASTQASAAPTTGLTFGAPTAAGGLSFSPQPATSATPAGGIKFAAPAAAGGLSFGTTGAPASVAPATAAVTSTGLSFGAGATPASSASFGAPLASSGFSLAPASATGGAAGATSAAAGLGFNPAASGDAGAKITPVSNPTTASSGFSLGLKTTTTSGLQGFSLPTTSAAVSTSATTPPSGITALGQPTSTPQTTGMLSLTTATTLATTAAPQPVSSLTFAQLEENINKWSSQLEEQERLFINQATQINAWDRLLIQNGEKMVQLSEAVQSALDSQQAVEHELTFIEGQQKELEELLAPLEKDIAKDQRGRDPEREHMYQMAETLDTQLKQMSEDLKEVIQYLNETNRSQDSNDPIVQIGRILNAHMSSMQWVDNSIAQISTKLDQLKATHDTLRRDNEQSFHLTYN